MRTSLKRSTGSEKISELKPTKTIQDEIKILDELKEENLTPSALLHKVIKRLDMLGKEDIITKELPEK